MAGTMMAWTGGCSPLLLNAFLAVASALVDLPATPYETDKWFSKASDDGSRVDYLFVPVICGKRRIFLLPTTKSFMPYPHCANNEEAVPKSIHYMRCQRWWRSRKKKVLTNFKFGMQEYLPRDLRQEGVKSKHEVPCMFPAMIMEMDASNWTGFSKIWLKEIFFFIFKWLIISRMAKPKMAQLALLYIFKCLDRLLL